MEKLKYLKIVQYHRNTGNITHLETVKLVSREVLDLAIEESGMKGLSCGYEVLEIMNMDNEVIGVELRSSDGRYLRKVVQFVHEIIKKFDYESKVTERGPIKIKKGLDIQEKNVKPLLLMSVNDILLDYNLDLREYIDKQEEQKGHHMTVLRNLLMERDKIIQSLTAEVNMLKASISHMAEMSNHQREEYSLVIGRLSEAQDILFNLNKSAVETHSRTKNKKHRKQLKKISKFLRLEISKNNDFLPADYVYIDEVPKVKK